MNKTSKCNIMCDDGQKLTVYNSLTGKISRFSENARREVLEAFKVPTDNIMCNDFLLKQGFLIHVVPSRHEPFGLSAIEAMAKGAFTIVSNVGGLPETLISQDIGKCIESENVDALASNIMDILENPIREDKRKILGESVSARFSWKVVAEETYRLYQSLLTEKRTN